jgi:hypothetical protein
MNTVRGVIWRTQDQADPGGREAAAAAMVVLVVVSAVTGVGGGAAVVGHRKLMNATGVVSWAIGPRNAGPRQRRSKPMWHRKKRPH